MQEEHGKWSYDIMTRNKKTFNVTVASYENGLLTKKPGSRQLSSLQCGKNQEHFLIPLWLGTRKMLKVQNQNIPNITVIDNITQ